MSKLSWGIISAGNISKAFARGVGASESGQLLAIASRTQEKADKFGEEFGVPRRYAGYEALLADPDVQAIYISTPHPMHAEWAVKAAEAGKHILCEKPLTLNYPEAMAVISAAQRNDVFLMEAFMYRCHPQTAKLVEIVKSGAIGQVQLIQATFSFNAGFNAESRLFKNSLGGGGILDVGCYCTSMARLIAGASLGKEVVEPIEVKGMAHVGVTGVDEYATAILKFPGEILAQLSTGVNMRQDSVVRIYGTEGSIFVPSPWFCGKELGHGKIAVEKYAERTTEEVLIEDSRDLYTIEADTVAANIEKRQAPSPSMTWDDSLGNMRTLDLWRMAIGVTYDSEKQNVDYPTIDRRPPAHRPGNNMLYGQIPGIEKPVSRLVMGGVLDPTQFLPAHCFLLFDEYFARGGTTIDTAHIYGPSEGMVGRWVKSRGLRDKVVILGKGAHTPYCAPEHLTRQLHESLDHLQTDYIDLYMMHRDNLDVPVGEFIDVLNEHKNAGRIKAFGGSNWTVERFEAANQYADAKGLTGMVAVSNQFSLAHCLEPVWDGCLTASEPEAREWFTKTQTPLFAWSSTAQGFFVWGAPDDKSSPDFVRCWHSEDNFRRLQRARELAVKRSVPPVTIALAYVLCQPFPTHALIGPRTMEEMRIAFLALDLELTSEDLRLLNLEE